MVTLVTDPDLEQRLRAQRAATGADRYDEVWDGTYMMAPVPNDEHQQVVMRLAAICHQLIDEPGLGHVRPGVNVSDRKLGWQHNYRVPDVAVFLEGGSAENCDAFWYGGPDFVVEVVSREDQSREKIAFYEQVSVRELLLVDRDPWRLDLYRLEDTKLKCSATSDLQEGQLLRSSVLPVTFRIQAGTKRPQIRVEYVDHDDVWIV